MVGSFISETSNLQVDASQLLGVGHFLNITYICVSSAGFIPTSKWRKKNQIEITVWSNVIYNYKQLTKCSK